MPTNVATVLEGVCSNLVGTKIKFEGEDLECATTYLRQRVKEALD
jgi:hypothetical protein